VAGGGALAPAVAGRGLVKFYGTTAALRACDLGVAPGERVALLGPNGAGKTTLLRLLATLTRPSSGSLALFGLDAVRHAARLRGRIGVLAHETYLYRDLTAAENLAFYARLYSLADPAAATAAGLARVGLQDLAARRVATLSRGQQQRVALARALLHAPDLLLLDEPDAGLDEAGLALFGDLLAASPAAVVLTTHSLERALQWTERVVLLDAGRVVYSAPTVGLDATALRAAWPRLARSGS
jgi:heme ABC exporter ATP-binding subunit CcmA